ncbi:MAG: carbohydrate ABC transporter permease [Clostridia bacterium]|nr:carbohydrate ABC transporter permease [Clostridia bacterium]
MRKSGKVKQAQTIFIIIGLIFLIHGLSLILPFVWMILTSFKSRLDFQDSFLGLPSVWKWENYTQIFSLLRIEVIKNGSFYTYNVFDMMANSLTMALTRPFFGLLSVVLCSYVVAKYDFAIRKLLFNINIFVMVIPIVGSLSTTLTVYKNLGIYNNLWPYIIFPGGPFGFNFLLLYGAFKAIPNTYSEAIFIDGGGHLTVFLRIILPMMLPTLSALYVLSFIGAWNDYSSSLIYLPSVPTLAYGLYIFQYDSAKYGASLPEVLAGFTICSIPSVALYCGFQKIITKSLAIGGLKE